MFCKGLNIPYIRICGCGFNSATSFDLQPRIGPEPLRGEIDEGAQAGRGFASLRMHDVNRHRPVFEIGEHGHQFVLRHLCCDLIGLESRQAPAGDDCVDDGVVGVADQLRLHRHPYRAVPPEPPFRTAEDAVPADQSVSGEVGRHDGHAVTREIIGRSADHLPDGADLPCGKRGGGQVGDADRDIDAFIDERNHPVEKQETHIHGGVPFQEVEQDRQHVETAEEDGGGDGQPTGRCGIAAGGAGFGFGHVAQDPPAVREILVAGSGELHRPGGADEEPGADALFKGGHRARDDGGRQPERPRRAGKTPGVGHRGKDPHRVEPIQPIPHYCKFGNNLCLKARIINPSAMKQDAAYNPETVTMQLYSFRLSGHAHRARLFLSLLGVPFEEVEVDLVGAAHKHSDFLRLNPFGQVPVLVDEGVVVPDSNAILVYLARKFARSDWLPDEPTAAAAIQRWLSVAAGEIAHGPARARLIKLFKAPFRSEEVIPRAHAILRLIDDQLGAGAFICGARPTIADVALYSYIARAPEGDVALDDYANIRRWLALVEALPGFVAFPSAVAA